MFRHPIPRFLPLWAAVLAVPLAGCSDMSPTQQRALTGTTGGAAGGAIIGAIAGNAGMGAAIGAATGLAGGLVYDYHKRSEQSAYQRGVQAGQQGQKQ
ncbi:glycine zipper family protein [Azospirillum isscasi]|uniref:Glycine zipper family protein n=1 Tax=Azospirillum isscasi TaxID=3053926 RepID=A0ABU0WBZ9_9PROT|nr:glycine zipper family protein [Azospirillum isscasi]MDQ2101164.1 glycine zipper family protein [Azospirillum isscasi]